MNKKLGESRANKEGMMCKKQEVCGRGRTNPRRKQKVEERKGLKWESGEKTDRILRREGNPGFLHVKIPPLSASICEIQW